MGDVSVEQWLKLAQSFLPVLTVVCGALWAVFTYVHHASKEAESTSRTRLLEAQQPFLRKQLDLYFETAELAGRLITEDPSNQKYKDDVKRFWALYWASLSMVEHEVVELAMMSVGDKLRAYLLDLQSAERKHDLEVAVYHLAHAIRAGIESSWGGGPDAQQIVAPRRN
jgi:hypothetical protein